MHLGAIRANCARILGHLPAGTRLFAVVKAGGYGHGALQVAHAALDGGATGLAVATTEEAAELGELVPSEQVLVMGGLTAGEARGAAAGGWSIAVSSLELAKALGETDTVVPVHLKIDTGMGASDAVRKRRPPWPGSSNTPRACASRAPGPISRRRTPTTR